MHTELRCVPHDGRTGAARRPANQSYSRIVHSSSQASLASQACLCGWYPILSPSLEGRALNACGVWQSKATGCAWHKSRFLDYCTCMSR